MDIKEVFPYGTIASRTWLLDQGVQEHTLKNYLRSKKLHSLKSGFYLWSEFQPKWQAIVASLDKVSSSHLHVGGVTALQIQGGAQYIHFKKGAQCELYSQNAIAERVKAFLNSLNDIEFTFHTTGTLWNDEMPIDLGLKKWKDPAWDEDFLISTPERAILEILHTLPKNISFSHADELFQGLTTLSPRRLTELLFYCRSVKVKRLFFWFADRYSTHG